MPRVGPYRFFFYSGDGAEPPHIHVEAHGKTTKFWLDPVRLARTSGFSNAELRQIQHTIADKVVDLLETWNDYFGQP